MCSKRHCYAYDTEYKYGIKARDDMEEVVDGIEICLADISKRTENNLLKFNQNETELMVFSSTQN